jgi:hypothetical protein
METDRTDRARDIHKAWLEEVSRAVEKKLGPEPEGGWLGDLALRERRRYEIGEAMRPRLLAALSREGLTEDDIPRDA